MTSQYEQFNMQDPEVRARVRKTFAKANERITLLTTERDRLVAEMRSDPNFTGYDRLEEVEEALAGNHASLGSCWAF